MLWFAVRHPDLPDWPLTLVISRRKGGQPWYLLTNERVETQEQAWDMVFSYARRWKIEEQFRFQKTELRLESLRLQGWEPRRKLLLLLTLAYSITQGNVGTAYRQRTQIQVFLFILIGVGWTVFQERRENKRIVRTTSRKRIDDMLRARV